MPLLGKLSNFFSAWTPSSDSPPTPPPQNTSLTLPSPPSHAISDQDQGRRRRCRRQTSGVRDDNINTEIGFIENHNQDQDLVDLCLESDNPNHAARFRSAQEHQHRSVRPRQSIPRPRPHLGMNPLLGERNVRHRPGLDPAEHRLFPTARSGPGETLIRPGMPWKKKPGQSPFRPVDRISQGSRESGPVRARGRPSQRDDQKQYIGVLSQESDRPTKRQRRDDQGTPVKTVDLSNDTPDIVPAPSIVLPSPSPSHNPKGKKRRSKRGRQDEFRQVENSVRPPRSQLSPESKLNSYKQRSFSPDDDHEESFTETAAKQRRSFASEDDTDQLEGPKHEFLKRVEIKPTKPGPGKPPLQDDATANGKRATSRDSPDELQGAATVEPVPTSLDGNRKANVTSFDEGTDRLQSSPSGIKPTVFESRQGHAKPNRKTKSKKLQNRRVFDVASFRYGPSQHFSQDKTVELHFDVASKEIMLAGSAIDEADRLKISLKKIIGLIRGESPSRKIRLELCKTADQSPEDLDLELSSLEGKDAVISLFRDQNVKIQDRTSLWMDKSFGFQERQMAAFTANGFKRPCEVRPEQSPERTVPKRPKVSASLQDDTTQVSGKERVGVKHDKPDPTTHSHPSRTDDGIDNPVKKFAGHLQNSSRRTRSMNRQAADTPVVCDDDYINVNEDLELQAKTGKLKKWDKPLVYPRFGKKKFEVDAQDLERLRDNEFLNDNLIGFYIRFLEDHLNRTNKEAAKKVYFFNSYFFATLTNVPRGKKSSIHYEGVEKWTRNVDIFSYDYIVVPINEAAHWYVAIICNLPKLRVAEGFDESQSQPDGSQPDKELQPKEVEEIPETPEPESVSKAASLDGKDAEQVQNRDAAKEDLARESLAAMTLDGKCDDSVTQSKNRPDDIEPRASQQSNEKETVEAPASTKSSKSKKKKPQTSPKKYDTRQPRIITFDSLDIPRSPTIRTLRQYLYEEAKSKRGIEIDTSEIKGMTAREIPHQPNWSDCGLYLLAYVEKFVQDPDLFIEKTIRKEMKPETDWPPLGSGLLRFRLRKFLDELYDEQDKIGQEKASSTMADMRPVSYLLGNPRRTETEDDTQPSINVDLPKPEVVIEDSQEGTGKTAADVDPPESYNPEEFKEPDHEPAKADPPIQSEAPKRSKHEKMAEREVIEVPDSQDQAYQVPEHTRGESTSLDDQLVTAGINEAFNGDDAAAEIMGSGSRVAKNSHYQVEVQIIGTPPPESSSPKITQKSPRNKQRV